MGIDGSGRTVVPGVGYATFDPTSGTVFVSDAKYRGPGGQLRFPLPYEDWTAEVQREVAKWPDGPRKDAIMNAIRSENVQAEIVKRPQ